MTTKDNTNMISMEQLGIESHLIRHDLTKYYKVFTKKQQGIILKKFKSIKDYINILYWLKFVKKNDYNEMAEILGINITNVYSHLGRNIENYIRTTLDTILPDYIDKSRFEIVVGVNTKNIISPNCI